MSVHDVLGEFEPETDRDRRGAQVLLAVAWAMRPRAGVDELVEMAIMFGDSTAPPDRRLVEQVALDMLVARGEAQTCR